jgi:ferrochelatase
VKGLLLLNLGTPDEPTTSAVRRYLAEFLSDPRVIDINPVGRTLLLYGVILPFRPKKSAAAYREVWDAERGSPLLFHGQDLATAVQSELGDEWRVELAMRYGKPSIKSVLTSLVEAGVTELVVMPLYPQYASSSTGSSLEAVYKAVADLPVVLPLDAVPDFYADPGFIGAASSVTQRTTAEFKPDHLLFSFHGLPERHVRASDFSKSHCLASDTCCDTITIANRSCYRAQSYATARLMAAEMGLADGSWSVSFQSRLGRTPWIQPYTDQVLVELAKAGVKRLAVVCPSFVADCLETLEEIGIRAREDFVAAGGEELRQVPCVNADPGWVSAICALVA